MKKLPDHISATIDECRKHKIDYEIWQENNKYKMKLMYKDKHRMVILAKTPSDWRVPLEARKHVRRAIHEMKEE